MPRQLLTLIFIAFLVMLVIALGAPLVLGGPE